MVCAEVCVCVCVCVCVRVHMCMCVFWCYAWWVCCVHTQISYMTSAWGRMCKILGQRFVQYLPVVMEPLLKVASIQPEITFIDCEWAGWDGICVLGRSEEWVVYYIQG